MEPLIFEPLIKQIRWGGRKLGSVLGKPIGDAADYAESWEIADHPSGQSVVANGSLAGRRLNDLLQSHAEELLGRHAGMTQFPLLIKFLDANDWLSLQVHPNDQQAVRYDPQENGKTEAWIIVDAEPDSQICAGLKSGVTSDDLRRHLAQGTVEETLNMIPAVPGECVFVPAQTVHALGPGILLAEIQQQSNLTFRLHDWGRMGSDGKPREIHVQESLECIDFDRGPVTPVTPIRLADGSHSFEELVRCDYFVIRRHASVNSFTIRTDDRFRILMLLEGRGSLSTPSGELNVQKGSTVLIPAAVETVRVTPESRLTALEVLYP